MYTDYEEFQTAIQPMVDEQTLMPSRIRLVEKIHNLSLNRAASVYYMGNIPSVNEVSGILRVLMQVFTGGILR